MSGSLHGIAWGSYRPGHQLHLVWHKESVPDPRAVLCAVTCTTRTEESVDSELQSMTAAQPSHDELWATCQRSAKDEALT